MPAYYTHYLVARETLLSLSASVQRQIRTTLPMYFFGAQGADFCFFYPSFRAKTPNLGSYLHRAGGYDAFSVLRLFAQKRPLIRTYALGFITHYAADSVFHPYVYARSGSSAWRHTRNESLIDAYFFDGEDSDPYAAYAKARPSSRQADELFYVYAAIAARCGLPPLFKTPFFRSISVFNAYLPVTSYLSKHKNAKKCSAIANEERLPWAYPADPSMIRTDDLSALFQRSVAMTTSLIDLFLRAIEKKEALPRSRFGKNFLTGV